MFLPIQITPLEDVEFAENHLKWVESVRILAQSVLTEAGELPPILFALAESEEEDYVQVHIPLEFLLDKTARALVLSKLENMTVLATLSVQSAEINDKTVALFALEDAEDFRVRSYVIDCWESGKKVLGNMCSWSPEENTVEFPTLIPRRFH